VPSSSEPPQDEPSPGKGLEDPRALHPAPETLEPELEPDPGPGASGSDEPSASTEPGSPVPGECADEGQGMVDPRHDRFGLDL